MTSTKYIGMDVHKESISIGVMDAAGKLVMECVKLPGCRPSYQNREGAPLYMGSQSALLTSSFRCH
jgi:hypothetical protein